MSIRPDTFIILYCCIVYIFGKNKNKFITTLRLKFLANTVYLKHNFDSNFLEKSLNFGFTSQHRFIELFKYF